MDSPAPVPGRTPSRARFAAAAPAAACEVCGANDFRPTSGGKRWCLSCGFLYS